jgi:hypothetical protein
MLRRSRLEFAAALAVFTMTALPALAASYPPRTFPKRAGGPAVSFTDSAVVARGATPGSTLYFAGMTLGAGDYVIRVERSAGSAVADAEGNASFAADIDTRSVWLVTDGTSGGYTVAAPTGMLLREIDFPGQSDEHATGPVRRLLLERYAMDVFLIRPGVGLWSGYLRDGGAADEDREINGRTDAGLSTLTSVDDAPSDPERLERGDLLFLVDRNTLEFHVTKRGN